MADETPADPAPDLALGDFRPRQALRVPEHHVPLPRFPAVDAHNHLGSAFGGEWATRDAGELARAMDASGVEAIVDLDGGWGEGLLRELDRWQTPLPGRVAVFSGLDYAMWATEPRFGDVEAARLRAGVAAGARGLKVWKLLGLRARDTAGRLVPVDDPRLDVLWATAGELGVPVTIHVADPVAFFEPLDGTNERWEELREHPDWHFWPTRPPGRPDLDGFPPFDELIDGLERVVVRHPGTTFIGAHVGCAAEDLARVSTMLERAPNLHVDLAARIGELGRQPYTTRAFIERWQDRVLFGTDMAPDPAWWAVYYRFLETRDESFPYDADPDEPPSQGRWRIHGLGLPEDVLRKVYRENALRLIRF
ncbi:MAG TPA: amidohydrolase family protein [Candidatus Limnocylindrales bacterium]|nr:amidohydrolase family protein [Candidatus Limnocylindrales bacterium]